MFLKRAANLTLANFNPSDPILTGIQHALTAAAGNISMEGGPAMPTLKAAAERIVFIAETVLLTASDTTKVWLT